ncbi:MAG: restriction endonuclease subunit S [Acidimicrobiia bacterium]|nr:restriction endonuclease subunit S [Acidimicrobiia bacterium]
MVTNQGFQNLVAKKGTQGLWLFYCVSAQQRELLRRASGSTFREISRGSVRSLPIVIPPLPEQRAIAAVLDSIDEAIERTEAVITATEQLREAVREELLTRGLPGWHSKWKDARGFGIIPAEWKVNLLRDVTEINRAQWHPIDGSTIFYLDLSSVVAPGRLSPPKEIPAEGAPSRARRLVRSGDILVSTVRPNLRGFARVLQAQENLIASTGFAVLSASPMAEGSFIYHLVMADSFSRYLSNAATGQAYPAVRPTDIGTYRFALPSLPEQEAIGRLLDSIDEAIESLRRKRDALTNVKASTAEALLTGQRRVPVEVER